MSTWTREGTEIDVNRSNNNIYCILIVDTKVEQLGIVFVVRVVIEDSS